MMANLGLGISKSVTMRFRYRWVVVMKEGDIQTGIVPTFDEALSALSAWYGDGTLNEIRGFLISPTSEVVYPEEKHGR